MSDETKTATNVADDDELSKAYDEFTGAEIVETPVEVQPDETQVEEQEAELPEVSGQQESSKLGRKYKKLETEFEQLKSELKVLKFSPTNRVMTSADNDAELDRIRELYREDPIRAKQEQDRFERKQWEHESQKYQGAYLSTIEALAKQNSDMHDEIFVEMMQNFNIKHSNNPLMDARVNYAEAKASVLAKTNATKVKRPGTSGGTNTPPAQPATSTTRTASKNIVLPPLDEYAADYVAYLRKQGVTDEEIMKSLK